YITGFPDRPPARPNLSIGDTIAALHGVIGALLALQEVQKTGKGQVVDVALHEAVFNCMESLLPEYDAQGYVRERSGSALPGIAPSNLYPCKDGYVLIAGNADSLYQRLMSAIGRADLLAAMEKAQVPAGRIYSAADIAADPHFAARGMIEKITAADGEPLKVPGIVPKLSATPGAIRTPAPNLGEHTNEVLASLGLSREEISRLKEQKVIA